jgi:hypothetical protein
MKIGVLVPVLVALSAPAYADAVWDFNNYKNCRVGFDPAQLDDDDGWSSFALVEKNPANDKPDKVRVVFYRRHLAKLEAAVRFLKKCRAWAWDRSKGKGVWEYRRGKARYLTPKEMKELE